MTDPISNVVDASCNEAIAQVTEALKQKPIKSLRAGEMAIAASQIVQRVERSPLCRSAQCHTLQVRYLRHKVSYGYKFSD